MDVLSFTINGNHEKGTERTVDPLRHWQMMLAAIDAANPDGTLPVIVVANNVNEWAMPQAERDLYWQVCKRATIVTSRDNHQGHYGGAAWACRMATEAAYAIGGDRLLFLAEDILLNRPATEILDGMGDTDYVGSSWGDDHSLSVQMFGCRLKPFVVDRVVFEPPFHIAGEWLLFNRLQEFGIRFTRTAIEDRSKDYFHHHDPDSFLNEAKRHGVQIHEVEELESLKPFAARYQYERVGHDTRAIELLDDGTIGEGYGAGEMTWCVRSRGEELRLSIFDEHRELICEVIQGPSGVWRGRWTRYERMEIVLSKVV